MEAHSEQDVGLGDHTEINMLAKCLSLWPKSTGPTGRNSVSLLGTWGNSDKMTSVSGLRERDCYLFEVKSLAGEELLSVPHHVAVPESCGPAEGRTWGSLHFSTSPNHTRPVPLSDYFICFWREGGLNMTVCSLRKVTRGDSKSERPCNGYTFTNCSLTQERRSLYSLGGRGRRRDR